MLIRFKTTINNGVCIIDNSKAYIFNSFGDFEKEKEGLTPNELNGILNFPIISILSSGNNTDIFVHYTNDTEKVFNTKEKAISCATKLTSSGDFVRMLRKSGKIDNVMYNQIIFVYKENVNVDSKLCLLDTLEERNA